VQVARRGQAQLALQVDLARGVVGQVGAAHHVGDALGSVINHHRQLVGPQAVGAVQDEVAHGLRHVLLLRAQAAVGPADLHALAADHRAQPGGAGGLAVQAIAAGAGVDAFGKAVVRLAQGGPGGVDLAPAAAAGVGQAGGQQLVQRRLVGRAAGGLPQRRRVGHQAQRGQLAQDHLAPAGQAARGVDVLNAHQPAAALGAGVQPAGQRGHRAAGMQRAGGRRGKAAGAGACRHRPGHTRSIGWPRCRSSRAWRVAGLSSCCSHHCRASPCGALRGCGVAALRQA
jgi:hypothetical protein